MVCLAALACAPTLATAAGDNRDEGHFFLSPQQERRVKKFKDGRSIVAYHQSGTVVSRNPEGPWRQATFFAQGTVFKDAGGSVVVDVALCETIDSDGDLTWSVIWRPADGEDTLEIKAGTGKWKGISGKGRVLDVHMTQGNVGVVARNGPDVLEGVWPIRGPLETHVDQAGCVGRFVETDGAPLRGP